MIKLYKIVRLCFLGNTQMNKITSLKKKIQNLKNKYWMALAANALIIAGDCSHNMIVEEKKQDKVEVKTTKPSDADLKAEEKGFVMSFLLMIEGCTLKVYTDHVGVNTVGLGSTYTKDGKKVGPNDNLSSNEEAIDLALSLYDKIGEAFEYVERNLLPRQTAAIGDCMYNCGQSVLYKEGKQTKLCQALNNGHDDTVLKELLTYNKAGGSFCTGLFFRRVLEAYVYQGFISMEQMQKCIIGGLGAVSCNKEIRNAFKLNIKKKFVKTKKGKKLVATATYDTKALKDINIAQKVIELCQSPIDVEMSQKMKDFHFGDPVASFIPQQYLCQDTKEQNTKETFYWFKKMQELNQFNKES